jgi:hypothetical protein
MDELGYEGYDPFGDGYVRIEQSGDNGLLQVDSDGSGDNFSITLATLEGVDVSDLVTDNALPAGPLSGSMDESIKVLGIFDPTDLGADAAEMFI